MIATDSDLTPEFRTITYSWDLSSMHIADQYDIYINQTTGVVTVNAMLDYETDQTEILLIVKASNPDGLFSTARLQINIEDRNEFPPQLSQSHYNIAVSEATPIDYVLFPFYATDEDRGPIYGKIETYRLSSSSSNVLLPFTISTNGYLVLNRMLDYETGIREYNFSITATDGGGLQSPPATVTINVQKSENRPPLFQPDQYIVSVEENYISTAPLVTLLVVTESTFIEFTILSDNEFSDHFSIMENGSLFLTMPLDYEIIQSTTIAVSVSDGVLTSFQPATVLVTVIAINDNNPQFEILHHSVRLEENLPQLSMEVILQAFDADIDDVHTRHGIIESYELSTEGVPFMLLHNPTGESTTVTNTRPLDAEQDPAFFTLLIKAFDGERTASEIPVQLIIHVVDVDDNIAQFEEDIYFANIEENYQGNVITIAATDSDRDTENRRISYVVTGVHSSLFQIFNDGTIINRIAFDYEQDELYHLVNVQTTNCNESQCQTILNISIMDTNDNAPYFLTQEYYFNISVDIIPSIGYVVGSVMATDADRSNRFGSVIDYRVRGSAGPFTVQATTGAIVINNPYELQQRKGMFTFEVIARDIGSQSASTSVNIFVPLFNIHPPIFEKRIYYTSWEENTFNSTLSGDLILQIKAQDLDITSHITYSLTEPSLYFILLSNGFLILRKPLDWEFDHQHTLFARAFDGKHNSTFNAEIRIDVIDQNDNVPELKPEVYYINISESFSTLASPVGQIFAQDNDSQGYLSFIILEPNSPVTVDSMGYVFLTRQLDYEQKSQYNITVRVTDGEHQSSTPGHVILNIIDENDNYPYFSQLLYQGRFPENTPSGTLSLAVSANDMDTSPANRNIARYEIQEVGLPFEMYSHHDGNIIISNSHSMDYETDRHVFLLHIHAYDSGGLRSLFPAQVTITLDDVDDCEPQFSQSVYHTSVRENNPISLFLTTLLATDCDISLRFREIRFSIPNPQQVIHIDPNSGAVVAATSFDYELDQNQFTIEVRAVSLFNSSQYDTATLNLSITDTNEHNPQFSSQFYKVSVLESASIARPIFQVQAFDEDGGIQYGEIARYWIIHSSISSLPFRINSTNGDIFITRTLDYENGDILFDVSVVAVDGGSHLARTSIEISIINENDEEPYFTGPARYIVSVPEEVFPLYLPGLPANALMQVKAFDEDLLEGSQLFYNLSTYEACSVDSNGYLYLTMPLDYEEITQYGVTISVSDGVLIGKTTVSVEIHVENINDNPPSFYDCLDGCCSTERPMSTRTLTVDENIIPNIALSSFSACDIDGDELEYFIFNFTHNGLAMRNNELHLLTPFDHEVTAIVIVYIGCSDGKYNSTNYVIVELVVNNVDDNNVEFDTNYYEISVDENMYPGDLYLFVYARDKDTPSLEVVYEVESDDVPFQIISTKRNGSYITNTELLDFESGSRHFVFNITAQPTDNIMVSDVAVATINITVLDENEFFPEFSSPVYTSTFSENMVGIVANVSAQDNDTGIIFGHVSYNIIHSPTLSCFINNLGEIINEYPLDADVFSPMHHILVEATDGGGLSTTAEVIIEVLDLNDNEPQFFPNVYTLSIPENTPANTSVLELQANDLDYSRYFSTIANYEIISSVSKPPFVVNSEGVLSISQPLDFEHQYIYSFSIKAIDSGGLSSSFPVTINIYIENVPDEPPAFLTGSYTATLSEGALLGTIVARIDAFSVDGGVLQYMLKSSMYQPPFQIDVFSGVITVNGSVDYEEYQNYNITIICSLTSNPTIYSTTMLIVQVENINDNSPMIDQMSYHAAILENAPHRSFSLLISASDEDIGNAGIIMDFQIIPSSIGFYLRDFNSNGTVSISNYKRFDYETDQSIVFSVIAIDRGRPSRVSKPARVHIDVLDTNDNSPEFPQDIYAIAVPESATGHVLTVSAYDRDRGSLSGAVGSYQLTPSTVPFLISNNGSISLSSSLDYDMFGANEVPQYEFSVYAYDSMGLSSDPVQVIVTVLNENDNGPTPVYSFEWPVKLVKIEWGTLVSLSPIFTLNVIDRDREDSLFFILSSAHNTPFAMLHMASGDIVLKTPLTRLTTYNLTITVQDRHPLLVSPEVRSLLWVVSVTIVDTNSPPYFSLNNLIQILNVPEGEGTNKTLLQVVALDDDYPGSLFAEIHDYYIVSITSTHIDSESVPFIVTNSGQLIQTERLNVAIATQYAFGIVAADGGGLMTPDPIAITVQIEERNDFAPAIEIDDSSSYQVYDNVLPGEVVLSVPVKDGDEGVSGIFVCSFKEQSDYFQINPSSCDISVKSSLNYSSLTFTNFTLTIIASDYGTPSLNDVVKISIEVIPAFVQELELLTNHTVVTYTEEGGPIKLLNNFTLIQGTHNQPSYVAVIDLIPGSMIVPELITENCKNNGNNVNIAECFPGFSSCLSGDYDKIHNFQPETVFPAISLLIPQESESISFQTWLKTDYNQSQSMVLVSGYSTDSEIDDIIFYIGINSMFITVTIGNISFLKSEYN